VLVALTQSPQEAVLVLIAVLLLQQLEGHILVPRVMHGAVGLSPLTVVISVIIGERLLGPLGAVLAVPIGAVVQVLVQDLVIARFNQSDTGMTGARVRAALEGTSPPTSPPTPDPADTP
jgi:putative heme transporter